ncbi:MAG: hypothetical protein GVY33_14065 [Alphaproteobacteria bacterium]|jgi:hypothetical protein|nr:hypothetical protein [Alphaproteobacteria bacterium]
MRRLSLYIIQAVAVLILFGSSALASKIDPDALRLVSSMCGSGLSAELQGEFDTRILSVLGRGSGSGEASVDVGNAMELLQNFHSDEAKSHAFRSYLQCVTQVVGALGGTTENSEIAVDNLLVPDTLSVIKSNKRFAASSGQSRALSDDKQIFFVDRIKDDYVRYRLTDLLSGENATGYVSIGESLRDFRDCSLSLYSIASDKERASFTYFCA